MSETNCENSENLYKTVDKNYAAFIRLMEPTSFKDFEVTGRGKVKCVFNLSAEKQKELRVLWDSESGERFPHPRVFIDMVKRIEDLGY